MNVWDERRLEKRLRITLKELATFKSEAERFAGKLGAIEEESERGDAQRERGEAWAEVVDAIDTATDGLTDALDNLGAMLKPE